MSVIIANNCCIGKIINFFQKVKAKQNKKKNRQTTKLETLSKTDCRRRVVLRRMQLSQRCAEMLVFADEKGNQISIAEQRPILMPGVNMNPTFTVAGSSVHGAQRGRAAVHMRRCRRQVDLFRRREGGRDWQMNKSQIQRFLCCSLSWQQESKAWRKGGASLAGSSLGRKCSEQQPP